MHIPFETYPAGVRSENRYFHRTLGEIFGHPRFQWAWSEDLLMPAVVLDDFGKKVIDYHCKCGVNMTAHEEGCNFTTPRPRWEMKNLLSGGMKDKWVCTVWRPPEATEADWESEFGGVPYPHNGYYIPVGTGTQCLAIFGIPFRKTSEEIAKHIKEHFSITEKERNRRTKENWARMDKAKKAMWRDQCLDAFPAQEGFPGQKNNVSRGGVGDSPELARHRRQLQQAKASILESAITGKRASVEVGGMQVEIG